MADDEAPPPQGRTQRRLLEEFDEPMRDVFLGFAAQGETLHAVAGILSMCRRYVYAYAHREGIRDQFPKGQAGRASKAASQARKGVRQPKPEAALQRYREESLERYTIDGVSATLSEHARRKGMRVSTVLSRKSRGWPQHRWLERPEPPRRPPPEGDGRRKMQ